MGRPVKTGTSVRSFFTEFHHVAQREVGPAKRKGNTDAQMVAAAQTIFFINRTQFRFRSTLLPTFAEPCAAYFGWPTNSSTSHKQWHQQLQHGIMLAPPQIGRTVAGRVGSPGARARACSNGPVSERDWRSFSFVFCFTFSFGPRHQGSGNGPMMSPIDLQRSDLPTRPSRSTESTSDLPMWRHYNATNHTQCFTAFLLRAY